MPTLADVIRDMMTTLGGPQSRKAIENTSIPITRECGDLEP